MNYDEPCEQHVWVETDVPCEICGGHPGLVCRECIESVDLIYQDDPRDTPEDRS